MPAVIASISADPPSHAAVSALVLFLPKSHKNPNAAKKIKIRIGKSVNNGIDEDGMVGVMLASAPAEAAEGGVRALVGVKPPRKIATARLKAEPPMKVQ